MKRLVIIFCTAVMLLGTTVSALAAINITNVNPNNLQTGVDINIKTITATFNTSMDIGSFEDRFTVNKGAQYDSEPTTTDNKTIVLTLTAPLAYSTTYKVTINKKVKDSVGNKLGATYTWTFTTMAKPVTDTTPPTVTATSPISGAIGVGVSSQITVTFSEIMKSSTISTSTITVNNGTSNIAGTVTLDATGRIATFTPTSNLSSNIQYTVTVSTGVTDENGNALTTSYIWNFRTVSTDAVPPTVISTSPISGATGVSVSTLVTATFSEAMDSATITTTTFTLKDGGAAVAGAAAYDPATFIATFTPTTVLANGKTYTTAITTGVKDLAGNAMTLTKTWTFTTAAAGVVPPSSDYCQIPPYVTSGAASLKPNVLLIIDNSGSMSEFAYKKPGTGTNSYDPSYDPATSYYGYFDNTKMYKYTTSGGYFEVDAIPSLDKASFWSGNFLNWLTMRRIDVVRKVLIGGKTQPRSASTANYLIPYENPDRDYYKTYNNVKYMVGPGAAYEEIYNQSTGATYNVKVYVGNQPPQEGLILTMSDKIRFGIMFYNDGYRYEYGMNSVRDGGFVGVDIGSTGNNLITSIESHDPATWTPLSETLYEATRYFQAIASAYNGGTYSGKDPIQYKCQKNFVLILTDGEATMDWNIPGTNWNYTGKVTDPYSFNVKTWMDSIATQEGYTSQWNVSANSMAGTYYLEGVAYYAHNTDLRTSTMGKSDIPGKQGLTIYTVFAFDESNVGRDLLKKTAKYGGFEDYDQTGKPDKAIKWDKNGDGIPDTYYEAKDGALLASSLTAAFNDILSRVSAGTAASILSNSEGSGANLLQAVFFPKKYFDAQTSADWIGEMRNLWYFIDPYINNSTVREDTDYVSGSPAPPHFLNLGSDYIVNFYFSTAQNKTLVKRYSDLNGDGQPEVDSNGDGIPDTYTFVDEVDPDYVRSIWQAGKQLWSRTSARTLYTQTSGSLVSFSSLDTTLASTQKLLQAANQTEADKIIAYIRGTDQSGYRSRTVNIGGVTGVWKLGDIVSSTPRLQSSIRLHAYSLPSPSGYGDTSYGNDSSKTGFIYTTDYANRGVVYVGANDGMLHAFNLGILDVHAFGDRKGKLSGSNLGEEQWAFIPKNVLPYLKYSADPSYSHLYYVDGTTIINDVSIGKPVGCTSAYWDCAKDTTNGSNWRTVLISSMGLGGASKLNGTGCKGTACVETPILDPADNTKGVGYSSYFALDVTNPASPSLLWEFADPLLGFSTPGAAIVKISAFKPDNVTPDPSKNGKWFVVLASGPTGPIDTTAHQFKGTSNQNLTIKVLNLDDGAVVATIDTLTDGTKLNNAFAGSITSAVIDTDRGNKLAAGNYQDDALYIGYTQLSGTTYTGGGVLRLVTGENSDPTKWKLSKVIDGVGPVTTNVARLQDMKNHNLWLYFGSGRYYFNQDDNSSQRLLVGIKEPCYTTADKLDVTCTTSKALTDLTDQSSTSNAVTNQGWYIKLEPEDSINFISAERVITDPVAMTNGAVFFTTFSPTSDVCSFGGNSYIWGTKYDTGLQAPASALQGKVIMQVSTGAFEEINLSSALTARGNRRSGVPITGKPPSDAPPIVTSSTNKPIKRILHMQEH